MCTWCPMPDAKVIYALWILCVMDLERDMNIVFATSDLYSRPAVVTIKSLLMNNTKADEINIYYIGNGISETNQGIIRRLVEGYGRKIEFIEMPESLNDISGFIRTNVITYSYCYFQDILPPNVDKVLLLEGDTVVLGNIEELYNTDITDYYLAAADDLQSKYFKEKIGIKSDSPYFNAGIILFNLKKWREDGITQKITRVIKSGKSKFMYEVQDEMNVCLEGHVKILPPEYNCTTSILLFSYKNMCRYRWPSTKCSKEAFAKARKKPVIVHFTKNQIIQSRPWVSGCQHPFKTKYEKIKAQTEVAADELWQSDRKKSNKIVHFFYSKVSQTFVAVLLGFVHAFLYPKILYKHILR